MVWVDGDLIHNIVWILIKKSVSSITMIEIFSNDEWHNLMVWKIETPFII